jgi:hypothetical protein
MIPRSSNGHVLLGHESLRALLEFYGCSFPAERSCASFIQTAQGSETPEVFMSIVGWRRDTNSDAINAEEEDDMFFCGCIITEP